MTGQSYVSILKENLEKSAEKMGMSIFVLQQDNDPKHKSLRATEFFNNNNIESLEWQAQSPDLNPIEHLWSILDQNIRQNNKSNKVTFMDELKRRWDLLPKSLLNTLVESLPNRLKSVIDNKDRATKYYTLSLILIYNNKCLNLLLIFDFTYFDKKNSTHIILLMTCKK